MKISLALGQRQTLSRQTAWGCLTTNLAMPGFGSLAAGRLSGYPQVALTVGGMALTMLFGIPFITWFIAHRSQFYGGDDPYQNLQEMWLRLRWAALGIALFAISLVWALATSWEILQAAKQAERPSDPPRLV
jgi:hypothetical protein